MHTANKPLLSIEKVQYTFTDGPKHVVALADTSFEVGAGEIVALVGPSGAGKSTVLRIATGLLKETSGTVVRNYAHAGMVFQDFALFPWLTNEENVAFGLQMQGLSKKAREKVAREKLVEVGLAGFEKRHPKELSGGMRQRVGIARALAIEPDLLLMDEPFSAIDSITADSLKKDILDIWHKRAFAILIVVHTIADAVELADRIIVFSQRPATVKKIFTNTLPRPRDMRSKGAYDLIDAITAQIDRGI